MASIDIMWVLISAGLVFLMQAGFLCLETGIVRQKNGVSAVMKNLTDFAMTTVFFWIFGFAIMFGTSSGGLFGTTLFAPQYGDTGTFATSAEFFVFLLFQVMFCGAAVTILAGSVAERLRFELFILIVLVSSVIIYPVYGHWAWNGLASDTTGWLEARGFIDFAGSSVVHSVGGWSALAILLILGARKGRFDENGKPNMMKPANIPLAALGVMILWFGWIGFNGGSQLAFDEKVIPIVMNTVMAGSTGLVGALIFGWFMRGRAEVDMIFNGSLGGLVAITAGCHAVTLPSAAIIGAIAGVVVLSVDMLLLKLKIDDAVGAVPVHLGCGIWGVLASGIFATDEILAGLGNTRLEQIGVQLLGIAAAAIWVFGMMSVIFRMVNKFVPLRVPEAYEEMGLDASEHGTLGDLIHDALGAVTHTGGIVPAAGMGD